VKASVKREKRGEGGGGLMSAMHVLQFIQWEDSEQASDERSNEGSGHRHNNNNKNNATCNRNHKQTAKRTRGERTW
jgi:hypothetical protein